MADLVTPELLDELVLGSARGRKQKALYVEVVRPLDRDDLPDLRDPPPVGAEVPSLKQLKYQHHQLAMLIARGTEAVEVSLITGYSLSWISNIQKDPAFRELTAYYQKQDELKHADAMARLHSLGIAGVEELQRRVDEEPEKWTHGQLMELVQLGLIKPLQARAAASGPATGAPSVAINVNFKEPEGGGSGPVIELKAREAPNGGA